jgi:hypothetical protein
MWKKAVVVKILLLHLSERNVEKHRIVVVPWRDKLMNNILTCMLKAGITEPEKAPVASERLGKHASATTNT